MKHTGGRGSAAVRWITRLTRRMIASWHTFPRWPERRTVVITEATDRPGASGGVPPATGV